MREKNIKRSKKTRHANQINYGIVLEKITMQLLNFSSTNQVKDLKNSNPS